MKLDEGSQQSLSIPENVVTVEEQAASINIKKAGRLSNAGRKRIKWLITQGYSTEQARAETRLKLPPKEQEK